jgi:hypothetical protein
LLTERKTLFCFLLQTFSVGTFVWGWIFSYVPINENISFVFAGLSWLLVSGLAALVLYTTFFLYSRWLTSFASQGLTESSRALSKTLLPLLFLPLDLLRNFIYIREIRPALLWCCTIGVFYLQYEFLTRLKKTLPKKTVFEEKPGRPLLVAVFFLTLFVYTFCSSGLVFPQQPLTGDEPHYLVITQSLVHDADINVRNNYENSDYTSFYPGPLNSHWRPGKKGNTHHYSRHTPALPILLAPFYWAAEKIAGPQREAFIFLARFPMSLMAALLGFYVFLTALRVTGKKKTSLLVWSVFSFSPPMLFYSHLIYPEIPAALFLILIHYFVISSRKTTPLSLFLAGSGIATLPWLGIKYTALTAVVFFILLIKWWKTKPREGIPFVSFAIPLVLSGLLYFSFLWTLYGSLSPFALYKGTTSYVDYDMATFFHFRFIEFFRCSIGYLFDQRAGLFPYAPVYILFLAGLYLAYKNRKKAVWTAVLIFASYWAFCSLGYYWGGYCPPGRTLLPVLWVAGLLLAEPLSEKGEWKTRIRRGLIAITVFVSYLCLKNPWLLYHDQLGNPYTRQGLQSHLLSSLSNSSIRFQKWVPALSRGEDFFWPTLAVWILAAMAITAAFVVRKKSPAEPALHRSLKKEVVSVFLLTALVVGYVFFDVRIDDNHVPDSKEKGVYFQDDNSYGSEEGGFWVKGKSSTLVFVLSHQPAEAIVVHSSSPSKRETTIRVGSSKKRVVHKNVGRNSQIFVSPVGFPWKGEYLYSVRIAEKSGFYPYQRDNRVQDNRFLGVFIRIEVIERKHFQNRDEIFSCKGIPRLSLLRLRRRPAHPPQCSSDGQGYHRAIKLKPSLSFITVLEMSTD